MFRKLIIRYLRKEKEHFRLIIKGCEKDIALSYDPQVKKNLEDTKMSYIKKHIALSETIKTLQEEH